jgi:hypothetical protein
LKEEERVKLLVSSSTMLRLRLQAGVLEVVVDSGRSVATTSLHVGMAVLFMSR